MSSKQANKKTSDWATYGRLLSNLGSLKLPFIVSIFGYLLYSSSQVLVADWTGFIIDSLGGSGMSEKGLISQLYERMFDAAELTANQKNMIVAGVAIPLAVMRGLGFFLGNYWLSFVSLNIVHRIRMQVFNKMLVVPSHYYDEHSSGQMITKVTYHTSQVTTAATESIKTVVREGLFVIGLLAYIFHINWQLSLIFLAVAPMLGIFIGYIGKRLRKYSRRIQDSVGGITEVCTETINGYKEVRLYGEKEKEEARFRSASHHNMTQSLKMSLFSAASSPIVQVMLWCAMAVIVWMALGMFDTGTAGDFVAYIGAAGMLAKPIRQLTEVYSQIQKGLAACDDLYEFIDSDVEVDSGDYSVDRVQGKIEFKNLSFAYRNSDQDVIKNINLTIEPGQTVALVGLSGSGKSTLISLLARFYDHDRGQLLLDGVDVTEYSLVNLRRQIAIVNQSATLFNDTIYNNIAYGNPTVEADDIHRAAETAHANEFIARLDKGLQTPVGEDGTLLSGGQKQRIAIARAIVKDAPILVFDEATASLDNKAENHIQQAMEAVMANRTTLVIAHRLSTIEQADVIVVMEEGEIVEQGSHADLMAQNKRYAQLYDRRFDEG
ncbi:Lipid A export ATP-binding/permease protein MsbA [Sinobacterium norvegicum]|uniref:Lipid A export ATP-binding/permease protein MsbA n=1 Tax=Sinobacterium norvegicum TaxID=1641715 RepID=A0ABM9A9S2_9GAMM|nr:lipid A export permease/ATP-binding protein MsbA [Sinobacterium norvegicum]CAH0990004.1 Lipid A export ATP-binding/permease protein MsbA [Sinobacterium norvegicum]